MIIENLLFTIASQEGQHFVLRTEDNKEIKISIDFLGENINIGDKVYLSLDKEPIADLSEERKKLLNEILDA